MSRRSTINFTGWPETCLRVHNIEGNFQKGAMGLIQLNQWLRVRVRQGGGVALNWLNSGRSPVLLPAFASKRKTSQAELFCFSSVLLE